MSLVRTSGSDNILSEDLLLLPVVSTTVKCGKQPVCWKDYFVEYWLNEHRKACIGRCDSEKEVGKRRKCWLQAFSLLPVTMFSTLAREQFTFFFSHIEFSLANACSSDKAFADERVKAYFEDSDTCTL